VFRNNKRIRLGFLNAAQKQQMSVDSAARHWALLLGLQPGGLADTVKRVDSPLGVEGHLRLVLQSRSGCTTTAHAKRYEAFHLWLVDTKTVVAKSKEVRCAVLCRYLMWLRDKGARRTVLSTVLMSLGWSSSFLALRRPWPTKEQQLKMIAQGHHRAKNAPASSGFFYEPCHIIQMARAVHKLPDPLDRLMLALEVGKFLGALRTSDLNFAGYHSWAHIKGERVLVGMCATTKSTNKTAGQLLQGCPFRIPLVPCLEATNWHVGMKECLL